MGIMLISSVLSASGSVLEWMAGGRRAVTASRTRYAYVETGVSMRWSSGAASFMEIAFTRPFRAAVRVTVQRSSGSWSRSIGSPALTWPRTSWAKVRCVSFKGSQGKSLGVMVSSGVVLCPTMQPGEKQSMSARDRLLSSSASTKRASS